MPPFTPAALETAIGKRLPVPAYEVRSIASEIFGRYELGGPPASEWRPHPVPVDSGQTRYELCRGNRFAGAYSSEDADLVQSLADALNELEHPR